MAARGGDDDKPFLSRWSQRKRQAAEEEGAPAAQARAETEGGPAAAPEEVDPATLPDVDSLEAGSDFTVFMREGVPKALKQRALRRLWQVDPAFRHICMLDDYNLDYTDAATVVPNLKTLFQVGRGMVLPGEDGEDGEAASATETAASALPAAESPPETVALPGDGGPAAERVSQRIAVDSGGEPLPAEAGPAESAGSENREPGDPSRHGRARAGSARRRRWGDADT